MKSSKVVHHRGYDGNNFSNVEKELENLRTFIPSDTVDDGVPDVDTIPFYDASEEASGSLVPANGLEISGTDLQATTNLRTTGIVADLNAGGIELGTGVLAWLTVPFACTITRVTATADQTGSIVVDIWKDTYANYPPTDADSITASAPVTISAGTKSDDTTLTGWTKTIAAGDVLMFNVDSVADIEHLVIVLYVTKT